MSDLLSILGPLVGGLGALLSIGLTILVGLGLSLLVLVISLAPVALVLMPHLRRWQRSQQLARTGIPAPAEVLAARDTGVLVNHRPQIELTVQVQPEQGEAFESRCVKVFDHAHIPRIQPGAVVEVRYDPADPSLVALASF